MKFAAWYICVPKTSLQLKKKKLGSPFAHIPPVCIYKALGNQTDQNLNIDFAAH